MEANAEERLKRTLLIESSRDDVGLWLVARWARKEFGIDDEADLRETTLALLGEMLHDGLLHVGRPDPQHRDFAAWPLSAGEAVERIRAEWNALGRAPKLGEIAWFAATERGEERALHYQDHLDARIAPIGD